MLRLKPCVQSALAALIATACATGWAQADQARGQKIVMGSCFLCHGENGESSSEVFPKLAGQHAQYIVKQLSHFKLGQRKSSTMAEMASRLSEADMAAVAAYFEAQTSPPEKAKDAELAGVGRYIFNSGNKYTGLPACASCHGKEGLGTAALPRLAGQYAGYIETQLKLFNKRERTDDNAVMHAVASKLGPLEIAAVAEYISAR